MAIQACRDPGRRAIFVELKVFLIKQEHERSNDQDPEVFRHFTTGVPISRHIIDSITAVPHFSATFGISQPRSPELQSGMPHPRGYGTNARVLGRYVREKKVIPVEEAVRRMSSLPAQRFKLDDRGILKPGYAADLVIFDEKTVSDQSTYDAPHAYSTGFSYVLVNGIPVIENGKHNGKRPGQVLMGKGYVGKAE
ncbi:MAG: hypothetical protein EOP04_32915 [Proteobacteria bacterium]|nr:MAG: hypothetical protein EOP04_32915 [Pseudomonadota bacterium]